ncbi:hypothetical protein ACSBR2_033626 [Camellia fascicularis]
MDLKCPLQILVASEIHKHPLTFRNKAPTRVIYCNICNRQIEHPFLCCIECNSFNIHVHCLPTLQLIVKHRDHIHPLVIAVSETNDDPDKANCCRVCKQEIQEHYPTYRCELCNFHVHDHCIFSEMEIGEREMEIPCHEHMLRLKLLDDVEKRGDDDDDVLCDGCNESFTRGGWAYGCTQCSFYLHLWCARLPQELQQHILHPQHPLTLVARAPYCPQTFHCKACRRTVSRGFSYNCSDCEFDLDVNCVAFLVAISTRSSHQILHPSHQHPFLVCSMDPNDYSTLNYATIHCSRCGLPLEKDMVYVCTECILLLHPLCAQLGQEIEENPFHPQHHLKLNQSADATLRLYKCNICRGRLDLFAYSCAADADSDSRCLFKMDLKCALQIPPIVAFEIHQHPLTFHNTAPKPQINCSICDQFIKYPFLWCMVCENFNIHVHCFPKLPPTSKSRHHRHFLSLTHSPIKEYPDEDESSEFYCDDCEKRRQLRESCYYCVECHYIAHVHCVFPQILDSIREESTFVVAQNEEEKVLTELNEEIAILEEEIKVETTQLDTLKTELKKIMDKHELFFKIGMSALKFA